MATVSKYVNGTGYGTHYIIRMDYWEEIDWNTYTSTNQSTICAQLYIASDNSSYTFHGYTSYVDFTLDGTAQTRQSTDSAVGSDWVAVGGTVRKTVTHNADGTRSAYFYGVFNTGYSKIYETVIDATLTLTTIPRYFSQTPTLTYNSATETTMNFSWSTSETCSQAILYRNGTAVQTKSSLNATSGSFDVVTGLTENTSYQWYVKCTRKDSGMDSNSGEQTKATYAYPYISNIGTSEITIPAPGESVSQSLTLYNPLSRSVSVGAKISSTLIATAVTTTTTSATLSLAANSMYTGIGSSAITGTITYTCTYSGVNKTATSTCKTSATNCGPTVSANPTYTNTSGTTHTDLVGTDTIIQGKSSFRVTAPAITTKGGATVAKYYFKIGNGNYENAGTTNYKNYTSTSLSGSVIAYCYAEDSRGYTSAVKQVTMRVLAYTAPTATITAARTGYTENGSITVTATRSTLSKSNATSTDTNKWTNSVSTTLISLAISPDTGHLDSDTIGTATASSTGTVSLSELDLNSTYTITVNISDKISTVTKTVIISKANPILSILNNNRVGINKPDPSCTFDVNGNVNITGNIQTDGANISINSNVPGSINVYDDVNINDGMGLKVTGTSTFEKFIKGKTISTGGGTSGYFYVCDIKNNSTYANQYMKFDIIQRGRIGHVEILFANSGTSGALTVSKINVSGTSKVYYLCTNNTFSLYVQKSESYDSMDILNWDIGAHASKFNITWKDQTVTSLPNGYVQITEGSPSMLGMYPIGSIYISVNNVNPSTYFGGTWEAFGTGKTLVGVDANDTDFNTVQKTGGAKTSSYTPAGTVGSHALTVNEMPSHSHSQPQRMVAWDAGWDNKVGGTWGSGSLQFEGFDAATTNSTGSGWGHDHGWTGTAATISRVQPYITVYMWKRTA